MRPFTWYYDPTVVPRRRMLNGRWQLLAYEDGHWSVDPLDEREIAARGKAKTLRRAQWAALRAFFGVLVGRFVGGHRG
jgi:hypothetical protein